MAMLWNFSEWMNRLGLQRQAQPELIYGVQPVVIMGDQSALVSPVLPPMAWWGGRRAGVAAVFSAIQITSAAAGGTFIRQLLLTGAASQVRWRITTTPTAMANLIAAVPFDMAPDPTVTVPILGTFAAQPATNLVPLVDIIGSGTTFLHEAFYLQPGTTLEAWVTVANTALEPAMLFEDLPATVPRS